MDIHDIQLRLLLWYLEYCSLSSPGGIRISTNESGSTNLGTLIRALVYWWPGESLSGVELGLNHEGEAPPGNGLMGLEKPVVTVGRVRVGVMGGVRAGVMGGVGGASSESLLWTSALMTTLPGLRKVPVLLCVYDNNPDENSVLVGLPGTSTKPRFGTGLRRMTLMLGGERGTVCTMTGEPSGLTSLRSMLIRTALPFSVRRTRMPGRLQMELVLIHLSHDMTR